MAVEFAARQVRWGAAPVTAAAAARPAKPKEWLRLELPRRDRQPALQPRRAAWKPSPGPAPPTARSPSPTSASAISPRRPRGLGGGGAALVHRGRAPRQARDDRPHHPLSRPTPTTCSPRIELGNVGLRKLSHEDRAGGDDALSRFAVRALRREDRPDHRRARGLSAAPRTRINKSILTVLGDIRVPYAFHTRSIRSKSP